MIPLTDNPVADIEDDAFNFTPYVRALHSAALSARPLPLTVGVFGGWGTGKSSFLSMWRGLFENEPGTKTVWFNPWKYDQKVEVWAALLHSVLAELSRRDVLRDKVSRLARAATWLSLRAGLGHAVSLVTAGVAGSAELNALLDTVGRDDSEQYRQINAFEHEFAEAVEQAVGPDGRLVVFIDDLDRCTPDAAITVLESLKLFMGNARCVFVLALDVDVLAAVSTNKFGAALSGAPEDAVSGMRYLEKIVQLPFYLPSIESRALRKMLLSHVGPLGESEAFWELLETGFGTNPRRLKRFVNVLAMSFETSPAHISLRTQLQFAKLLIIRSEHRDFFHHLIRRPEAWAELERARELPDFYPDLKLMELIDLSNVRGDVYHNHPPAPSPGEVRQMLSTLPPWLPLPGQEQQAPGPRPAPEPT